MRTTVSLASTLSRGRFWKPSTSALTTTKAVLVPGISPGLQIQGSTCLLGGPSSGTRNSAPSLAVPLPQRPGPCLTLDSSPPSSPNIEVQTLASSLLPFTVTAWSRPPQIQGL